LSDDEINKRIDDTLDELRHAQSQQDQNQVDRWLNEYLNFLNVSISELMFAALANEVNLRVDFVPTNNSYDYDIIINGHPCQIKTLFCYDLFPVDKLQITRQEEYVRQYKTLRESYNKRQIRWSVVNQEIIKYIKSDCIDKINYALRQKAQIIILDGTRTIAGLLLNYYYTDDTLFVKIYDSFIKSLKSQSDDFVPIIFASTSYDNKFRISSLVANVPVSKVYQVDKALKTKYTYSITAVTIKSL
jgi:hypothetical protein